MDLLLGKKHKAEKRPLVTSRYAVIKHNQWRGKYRRILCVTPSALITQNPDQNLFITNVYTFCGESDIDGISVGPGNDEEGDFVLSARQDKKVRVVGDTQICKQVANQFVTPKHK